MTASVFPGEQVYLLLVQQLHGLKGRITVAKLLQIWQVFAITLDDAMGYGFIIYNGVCLQFSSISRVTLYVPLDDFIFSLC